MASRPSLLVRGCRGLSRCLSTHTNTITETVKPYYVSTPIFYVNAAPHIGHLYTSVIADVLARYSRLLNPDRPVFFNTGTDEHGLKIQRAAQEDGSDPRAFCDRISARFKALASAANISHDRFMRTTDADHLISAQHFWRELQKRGAIYKGHHAGWYSVSDECFYSDSQVDTLVDPNTKEEYRVAKETGQRVEWAEEENHKFRMSAYREPLLDWLKSNENSVYPPSRRDELIASLADPDTMRDLSISRPRSRLQWGIPVPDDDEHTMYVWLEALVNYLTATGYPWKDDDTLHGGRGWPTDVHVVGKDIVKFHAMIFPSLLLALDIPLPKTILAHAHWTMDRQKMSKSRGNVANPFDAMDAFGVDAIRWYLVRIGGGFVNDSDWSEEQINKHYTKDLQGMLGNLLSRLHSPKLLATFSALPSPLQEDVPSSEIASEFFNTLAALPQVFDAHMTSFQLNKAAEDIVNVITDANSLFTALEWWAPLSQNPIQQNIPAGIDVRVATSVKAVHEALRVCGILLQPIMPIKAAELLDALGAGKDERGWVDVQNLKEGRPEIEKYVLGGNKLFLPLDVDAEVVPRSAGLGAGSKKKKNNKKGKGKAQPSMETK